MKAINAIISASIFILIVHQQIAAQDSGDDVVWKALGDEVQRNMDSLRLPNCPKPCFISLTMDDVYSMSASSSLGGILQSDENKFRGWSDRLLVGTYKLNDENFTGISQNDPNRSEPDNIPIENDYYGIRRSFWSSLDRTYRSATRNYNEKIASINNKEIEASELELADFSEAPKVVSKSTFPYAKPSKEVVENYIKRLSSEFLKYPSIINSNVQFNLLLINVYFLNSEGTEVKTQIPLIRLSFTAGIYDDYGSLLSEGIHYYSRQFNTLPPEMQVLKDIGALVDYLNKLKKAPMIDESYNGPLLLEGQSSKNIFLKALFNNENSLISYREQLVSSAQSQLYYSRNRNSLETKIGRVVAPKSFTIKDIPALQDFDNKPLLGGFKIDAEGVRPPDTLMLIENGVLKNLLSSRTPSKSVPISNGHKRFMISQSGTTEQVAPGNIMIVSTEGQSKEMLKEKLINQAKELGLDYAYIVRPLIESDGNVPEELLRINLETGKEELVRADYQPDMGNVSFRDLALCSKKLKVFNFLFNGAGMEMPGMPGGGQILRGIPMSLVSPDAVLISKGRVIGDKKPLAGHKPDVPNPLE